MRTVVAIIGALTSTACVVTKQSGLSDIDRNLARYIGVPKEQIIARLGAPETERTLANRTVLAWTSRRELSPAPAVRLSTTGAYAGEPPVASLVSDSRAPATTQGCELRLVMTEDGRKAEQTQWSGNRGLCQSYLRTLERRRQQAAPLT
jgi:hypothetical protein